MVSESQLSVCMGLVKQFLHCPICLDDVQNPVVTPCAHTYCKLCIDTHIGKKRKATCPLCKKVLNVRSLTFSNKVTKILDVCRRIVNSYQIETSETVVASDFRESLHLSQEMTQAPSVCEKSVAPVADDEHLKSVNHPTRSRILLGTAARTRHVSRALKRKNGASFPEDIQTQPMYSPIERSKNDINNTNHPLSNSSHNDLNDLFTFTQLTQPMVELSYPEICSQQNAQNDINNSAHDEKLKQLSNLPPLPPKISRLIKPNVSLSNAETSFRRTSRSKLKRSITSPSPKLAPKYSRRDSNCTILSAHNLVTKTHEVMHHVQQSTTLTVQPNHPPNESNVGIEVSSNKGFQQRSAEIREGNQSVRSKKSNSFSFGSKITHTPTFSFGKRLLKKYRISRFSENNANISQRSFKSPGWSRWRQMYHEMRRRSSGSYLKFKKVDATSKLSDSLDCKSDSQRRSVSGSSRISASLSRWGVAVSRRSKRKTNETRCRVRSLIQEPRINSHSVSERMSGLNQEVGTHTSSDSIDPVPSMSSKTLSAKVENCRFVVPLHQLSFRDYFNVKSWRSHSRISLPNCVVSSNSSPVNKDVLVSSGRRSVKCPNNSIQSVSLNQTVILNNDSPGSSLPYQTIHCSACGETLMLEKNLSSFSSPNQLTLSNILQQCPSDISGSISSSYWQAEDPGDSLYTGLHLDALVEANQKYSETKNNSFPVDGLIKNTTDVKDQCRSCLGKSGGKSPDETKSILEIDERCPTNRTTTTNHPVGVDTDRVLGSDIKDSSLSNGTKWSENFDSSNNLHHFPVEMSSPSSPEQSAYQNSSSELMPTIDRERLRHECEEIEAVVATLQQQLEAQVGELSPQSVDKLIKSAGTEPLNDDMVGPSPISSMEFNDRDGNQEKNNASETSTNEPAYQVFETCASENPDVIPSSQTEEDLELIQQQNTTLSTSNTTCLLQTSSATTINTSMDKPIHIEPSQSTDQKSLINDLVPDSLDPIQSLTQCPETNLSMLSDENTIVSSISKPSEKPNHSKHVSSIFVTGSNLAPEDVLMLQRLCNQFSISEHKSYIPRKTTHVVIKEETGRPRVVKRTLKYFKAILDGAWLVNTEWVHRCLNSNTLLDETPFEIQGDTVCGYCHEGPKRSRLRVPAVSRPNKFPLREQCGNNSNDDRRPFSGLWMCAYGSLGDLEISDFIQLAADGGSDRVFGCLDDLINAINKLVNSMSKLTSHQKPRALLLTNRDETDCNLTEHQEVYHTHGIPIISVDWMLNCISLYRRIPITQHYRICPSAVPTSTSIGK